MSELALELWDRRRTTAEGADKSSAGDGGGEHWSLKVPYSELDALKVWSGRWVAFVDCRASGRRELRARSLMDEKPRAR